MKGNKNNMGRKCLVRFTLLLCLVFSACGSGSSLAYRETSGTVWLVEDLVFNRTLLQSIADQDRLTAQQDAEEYPFNPDIFLDSIMQTSSFQVATFPYIEQYSTKPFDGYQYDNTVKRGSATGIMHIPAPPVDFKVQCMPYYVHYPLELDPLTGIAEHDSRIPVDESEDITASDYEFRFTQKAEHWEIQDLEVIIRVDRVQLEAAMQQLFAIPLLPQFKDGNPQGFSNLVELEQRLPVAAHFGYTATVDGIEYSDEVRRVYNLGISPH
ncbi:hypothetical protein KDL44_13810 [bacterium]|nr:hypothetical protein [bacterium]